MKRLVAKISNDLENFNESYIYNSELARVWPKDMPPQEREKRIRQFAKEHGLLVDVYQIGMCAIFKKSLRDGHKRRRSPKSPPKQKRIARR